MTDGRQNNLGVDEMVDQLSDNAESASKGDDIGRIIGGRYRLVAALGTGASATVFLAEDLSLRRKVAVKLLHPGLVGDPKFRRRFRAEAQSAAQMSHPHLMAVHDWGDEGEAYLVTELLPGGSLRQMIDSGARVSPSQALVIGLHAAEGLDHAHKQGFVHRDIKPANLLFGLDGRLRVADFGIARAVAEAAWTEPEGALIGTARYAAPEQAAGSNVDGRADVYSLALTLIEGVTGEVPLTEATPLATMLIRQDNDVPRVAELGPLADVIQSAGRADRDARPTSADFVRHLNAAASSLPRPKRLPLVGFGSLNTETNQVVDLRENGANQTNRSALEAEPTEKVVPDSRPHRYHSIEDVMDLEQPVKPPSPTRRRWPWIVMFVLLAVSLAGLIRYAVTDVFAGPPPVVVVTHPVESYIGLPASEARASIEELNWTVQIFRRHEDGTVEGQVLEQTPLVGAELDEGLEVSLWVSEGPVLHETPVLIGLTLVEATTQLVASGLAVGKDTHQFAEDAPEGTVLGANLPEQPELEPGTELATGTKVDLTISDGPEPRSVPELLGLPPEAAQSALEKLGLTYVEAEERQSSKSVGEGLILSADFEVGASAERGQAITVVISSGLPFVAIPDVKGLTGSEASTILENAGFKVTGTSGSPNAEVIETNPPIGESHRFGTAIDIFTR